MDHERLQALIGEQKRRTGIVDIQEAVAADRCLPVGDEVMHLVVAGDAREIALAV